MKTYREAMRFLYKYVPSPEKRYPGEAGLERMRKLLDLLGNPQDKYPTVHVGGTSGKTSTSYFIARILQDAGYKTGLHISPHLQVATERMQVNGRFASEKEFVQLIKQLSPLAKKLKPSYFELLLAASFLYFAQKKVDIAVLEVGLGGRYDGTNVITPVLAVITNVGLDHTHILGDTVEKITLDKREIIKPETPIVTGVTQKSVLQLIKQKANNASAPLTVVSAPKNKGDYQQKNTLLAKNVALHLNEVGFVKIKHSEVSSIYDINDTTIKRSLRNLSLPGRLERVAENPTIILDGAHNPEKMKAAVSSLSGKWYTLFAATRDKDFRGMLKHLLPITKKLYITQYEFVTDMGYTMGQPPVTIAEEVPNSVKHEVVTNAKVAFKKAKSEAGKNGKILITGSLYLVGEIRNIYYPKEEVLKRRKYRW